MRNWTKKFTLFIIGLMIFARLLFFFQHGALSNRYDRGTRRSGQSAKVEPVSPQINQAVEALKAGETPKPVDQIAPLADDVRKEVEKNPDATPSSLLLFAVQMSKKLELAKKSQDAANSFFEELDSCLTEAKPIAQSARALCLQQGKWLSQSYPALQGNFDPVIIEG